MSIISLPENILQTLQQKSHIILAIGATFILSEIGWKLFCTFKDMDLLKKLNIFSREKIYVETIFLANDTEKCKLHLYADSNCDLPNCAVLKLRKIENFIQNAKKSLDICVYFLTHQILVQAIKDAHRREVDIRIITDDESKTNGAGQFQNFSNEGIKIRTLQSTQNLMHHKFAVIDKKLLITGSANWTSQAFFGNNENILITNEQKLIKQFLEEFDCLWVTFENP